MLKQNKLQHKNKLEILYYQISFNNQDINKIINKTN